MKRSDINGLIRAAHTCFQEHGWAMPPKPRWDVTDFGLGDISRHGLILVNLAEEREYCEKLMWARKGMTTPIHCHRRKKEDIICRWGTLGIRMWRGAHDGPQGLPMPARIDGVDCTVRSGEMVELAAGSRVTMGTGIWHTFAPLSEACIIGEVSTVNDDVAVNHFTDPAVGRFPDIDEDVPADPSLCWETQAAR